MKRFQCPRCKKHNIREISTGGVRISDVVIADSEDFVCSRPKFHGFEQEGNSHYECSDCKRSLGRDPRHIIEKYFVDTSISGESPYGENACKEIFLKQPEGNLSDPIEMVQLKTAYKIKPLKKCDSDSPSVRETIDMINFVIAAGMDNAVEVDHDDGSQRTKELSKVVKERPHLFERVCV